MNNDNGIITGARSDKAGRLAAFALLFAIAGLYGFIYEMLFYFFNGGMSGFYWRGSCFGPWISIYGFGSFLIYFLTHRLKGKPLLVFLVGGLGCGAFELISGAALFYGLGHRGWNYNLERWNFGNIGGFICLRSVLVFGLSSLVLVYVIIPLISKIQQKMSKRAFAALAFTLAGLFILDLIYNLAIAPNFPGLITANAFYQGLGFQLMEV